MNAKEIIEKEDYEGIRDQDGWETLELTVRENHPPALAVAILAEMEFRPLKKRLRSAPLGRRSGSAMPPAPSGDNERYW